MNGWGLNSGEPGFGHPGESLLSGGLAARVPCRHSLRAQDFNLFGNLVSLAMLEKKRAGKDKRSAAARLTSLWFRLSWMRSIGILQAMPTRQTSRAVLVRKLSRRVLSSADSLMHALLHPQCRPSLQSPSPRRPWLGASGVSLRAVPSQWPGELRRVTSLFLRKVKAKAYDLGEPRRGSLLITATADDQLGPFRLTRHAFGGHVQHKYFGLSRI